MLGSPSDAEDVTHDAFLRAYAAELGDQTPLSATLLTVIARRLALNEIRNRTRRATDAVGDMHDLAVLSLDDPESRFAAAELQQAIASAIAKMPPQCRRVFEMRKLEHISHAEIAFRLDIAPKTVERHLTKAIRLLRDELTRTGHGRGESLLLAERSGE